MAAVVRILLAILAVVVFSTPAHAFCWDEAAADYGLNPEVLKAVSAVESNHNQSAVHWNKDGTYDACHMQINSGWYFRLKKRYGKGYADRAWSGLADPCYCTKFGAFVLSDCIARYGDTWRAVGCYNAGDSAKAEVYARKVHAKWRAGR
jgi:soluble lytic murein transglycosylase-like protein